MFRPDFDEKLADASGEWQLDLAISMSDSVEGDQLSSIRMRTEEVYLFATPDHPLATAKRSIQRTCRIRIYC